MQLLCLVRSVLTETAGERKVEGQSTRHPQRGRDPERDRATGGRSGEKVTYLNVHNVASIYTELGYVLFSCGRLDRSMLTRYSYRSAANAADLVVYARDV